MEDYIDPFVLAASTVLKEELKMSLFKHKVEKETGNFQTEEISVIIGMQGELEGQVFLELSFDTANRVVQRIMNEVALLNGKELERIILSGIAELGNIIAGRATILLEAVGKKSTLSPPTIIYKKSVVVSTLDINRYKIVLSSEIGQFTLRVGLKNRSHR
ncbi:MAG: hypothetical protein DKM50_04075 [Candidatus Margulisiibacteriota bacterium]|nr:MAG: hypothetical protein A2X43_01790 [Candidatus Margulisbacteria bacterium GWD2_39_127]OGI05484.1 MAG: hypothetical protein A2X42_00045 [Candidatus Margulisbacteria bacterium GWF2_38_17]OGI08318.1 MAG: hypothetical protein A2X41_00200 [Candidatus Margulisbacteria bacterium GWE2_39_32]PZM82314.1 MAG: hypothetical protein DKM50_04075 [Candidatus Margulisiibacteriota bacterium]HAR62940.1 hypothetical protein [Candidatus Margulisiibacteriota bacterium]